MTARDFDTLARRAFGHVLEPLGFTNEGSQHCTFYRKLAEDVCHVIIPELGSRGVWYDVQVFPHSPRIYPLFERRFPDALGIPTDVFSSLSEEGVGLTQQTFHCRTEEGFLRNFQRHVKPLLLEHAVPYLDHFRTVADILPAIQHPAFRAFALYHLGRIPEALESLRKERARLFTMDTSNEDVRLVIEHIDKLLAQH